jgi:hypothetical protein
MADATVSGLAFASSFRIENVTPYVVLLKESVDDSKNIVR